ncbi:hypothetical protein PV682_35255 [Streptomyces niveiscabiei]|uniref:hypothetical protein n=1 Tax=Streptomyces niveiscabiei TaxID=164115 RepID=UPI0029A699DC|nr:hypothetical protein [Streptomyces niveiscabiei]MDX3386666.1 hypothetical protein [Streptomyces niveiscabiei]
MALIKLGKDPESKKEGSPTVYLDDQTDNYVLQGWELDPERRRQMDIPEGETAIEFPRRMMQFFPEVIGRGNGTDN